MRHIHRSALVAASCELMFDLINDVAGYPDFVPGCSAARVLERSDAQVRAELTVGSGLMRTSFTTCNRLQRPHQIEMRLESGPLKSLDGRWRLTPVAGEGISGCRVELELAFEPQGGLAALTLGAAVERLAGSLVDAFVARARQLQAGADQRV